MRKRTPSGARGCLAKIIGMAWTSAIGRNILEVRRLPKIYLRRRVTESRGVGEAIREVRPSSRPHPVGLPVPYVERFRPPIVVLRPSFCTPMLGHRPGVPKEVLLNGPTTREWEFGGRFATESGIQHSAALTSATGSGVSLPVPLSVPAQLASIRATDWFSGGWKRATNPDTLAINPSYPVRDVEWGIRGVIFDSPDSSSVILTRVNSNHLLRNIS